MDKMSLYTETHKYEPCKYCYADARYLYRIVDCDYWVYLCDKHARCAMAHVRPILIPRSRVEKTPEEILRRNNP